MFYGRSRFTEDVDFVAASGHMETLAGNPRVMREYRFEPSCTSKLYHESGVEIDIWKDEFSDAIIARAVEAQLGELKVRIAEPSDLVAMKLRAGRFIDDYDISEIVRHARVDARIIQQRVTPEQFHRFEAIIRRLG